METDDVKVEVQLEEGNLEEDGGRVEPNGNIAITTAPDEDKEDMIGEEKCEPKDIPVLNVTEGRSSDVISKEMEQLSIQQRDQDESDEGDSEKEEADESGYSMLDVREFKRMSLDEVKLLKGDGNENNPDTERRQDQPVTKIVVRRLPPNITIEGYLEEIPEMPSYNYIELVHPNEDFPSRVSQRSAIYINFDSQAETFWFKEKYNSMKFFDERGNSYIACVDYSLCQEVPPPDKEESEPVSTGTLEETEEYQEFLKKFEEDPYAFSMERPEVIPTPEAMLEEIMNRKVVEIENTPLLQYIRHRSEAKETLKKDRENRLREKELARKKRKEEAAKKRQKERDEAAKKRQKEKEEAAKRRETEGEPVDGEKVKAPQKLSRKERERERQRERDRERKLRREKIAAEKEAGRKTDPASKEKPSSQSGKESSKSKDKDGKPDSKKGVSVTVTYSKSGNPTRWSENSGPRKLQKEDFKKSQELVSPSDTLGTGTDKESKVSSSTEKLPIEKERETFTSTKSAFGKPFPIKESTKPTAAITNKEQSTEQNQNEKDKAASQDKRTATTTNANDNEAAGGGTGRKKIVKKVIKIKKVVKDKDGSGGSGSASGSANAQQDSTENKTKKIIRVVRKSSKPDDGGVSSRSNVPKTESGGQKGEGDKDHAAPESQKSESEKERRNRKGRPEIQIYRPGSLRGGNNKPSTSSGGGEKDRDNNNT